MKYKEAVNMLRESAIERDPIPVGVVFKMPNGATVCIAAGSVYATDRSGAPILAVNGPLESLNAVTIAAHLLQD